MRRREYDSGSNRGPGPSGAEAPGSVARATKGRRAAESLVAPLILTAAVVSTWGAALGLGGLAFGPLLGFEGLDPGIPLMTFVLLVALGVDYGIFLMHRTREESLRGVPVAAASLIALRRRR
ncbi:MMPL family transporter [Streptomyces sp. 891-h]|uniref:MMPL family transporter n=1 Tax=Streptomyces sp. 891-h TaxID=2720714 RepID=UPI00325B5356